MNAAVLWQWLEQYPVRIDLILLAVLTAETLILLVVLARQAGLNKRYCRLLGGKGAADLEKMLINCRQDVEAQQADLQAVSSDFKELSRKLTAAVQHVGVERFNAFSDVGSDLSYAVALLDSRGDGVVLSSLYGRDECRTFAKPVTNGKSTYHLTDEEERALAKALGYYAK